jgi:hypothetical protein
LFVPGGSIAFPRAFNTRHNPKSAEERDVKAMKEPEGQVSSGAVIKEDKPNG